MASTKYVLRTYVKPPSDPLSSAFNWIELDRRLWSHEAAEDEGEGESHSILSSHLPLQFPSPEEQNRTVTLVYQVIGLNDSGSSSIPSVLQPLLSTKPRSIDRSDKQTKPHAEHVYLNWIECISYIIIKHKLWQACDWSMSNWIHRNFHLHQHSPPSIHCRSSPHSHGRVCARSIAKRPTSRQVSLTYYILPALDWLQLLARQRQSAEMDGWMGESWIGRDHFQLIYYLTKWSSNLFNNWFTLYQCQFMYSLLRIPLTHSPLANIFFMLLRCPVQFQRFCRNWNWHSSRLRLIPFIITSSRRVLLRQMSCKLSLLVTEEAGEVWCGGWRWRCCCCSCLFRLHTRMGSIITLLPSTLEGAKES